MSILAHIGRAAQSLGLSESARTVVVAVAASTATCAVPIPLAGAPILISEQVAMMAAVPGFFKINIEVIAKPLGTRASRPQIFENAGRMPAYPGKALTVAHS